MLDMEYLSAAVQRVRVTGKLGIRVSTFAVTPVEVLTKISSCILILQTEDYAWTVGCKK